VAIGDVEDRLHERLVERNERVTEPRDARLVAERLADGCAQRDADVFDGVVNIDGVEIVGWDTDLNAPDTNAADGRAFIVAKFGAELNISNATLSYLGMSVGKTDERGVTWDSASAVSASGIVSRSAKC